jgi:hypothetical protein
MFIRIIETPPGEAPEEVRQEWVGLDLPLAAGESGPRMVSGGGVLSGPRSFLGILLGLLTGRMQPAYGYIIDAPQALVLLAEKSPWAAQWWRECAPHCWELHYRFIFPAEVCTEVAGPAHGRPHVPPDLPSEELSFTPPPEADWDPTPGTPGVQKERPPAPD